MGARGLRVPAGTEAPCRWRAFQKTRAHTRTLWLHFYVGGLEPARRCVSSRSFAIDVRSRARRRRRSELERTVATIAARRKQRCAEANVRCGRSGKRRASACARGASRVPAENTCAKNDAYLVDPASSHMLVSKIKPCKSKFRPLARRNREWLNTSVVVPWSVLFYLDTCGNSRANTCI